MKNQKHTPGPWTLTKNFHHDRFNLKAASRETFIGDITIDRHHADFTPEEAVANAHLIAAAPEMLEALESVLNDNRLMNAMSRNQARLILDAMAKARGEA